jgi:O-antigen/teichoic acid export membrane protein
MILVAVNYLVFKIFVKGDFVEAFYQVPILYVGVFLNSLVSFFGGIYIALEKTKKIGMSSLAGAVINITLNVLFIHYLGLYAASISTVISYFAILLYRAHDLKKFILIPYNKKTIVKGMASLLVVIAVSYLNSLVSCVIAFSLALGYNVVVNKYLLTVLKTEIKGKFKK